MLRAAPNLYARLATGLRHSRARPCLTVVKHELGPRFSEETAASALRLIHMPKLFFARS
jgi:hypothetical protein